MNKTHAMQFSTRSVTSAIKSSHVAYMHNVLQDWTAGSLECECALASSYLVAHGAEVHLVSDDLAVPRSLIFIHGSSKCFVLVALLQL